MYSSLNSTAFAQLFPILNSFHIIIFIQVLKMSRFFERYFVVRAQSHFAKPFLLVGNKNRSLGLNSENMSDYEVYIPKNCHHELLSWWTRLGQFAFKNPLFWQPLDLRCVRVNPTFDCQTVKSHQVCSWIMPNTSLKMSHAVCSNFDGYSFTILVQRWAIRNGTDQLTHLIFVWLQ